MPFSLEASGLRLGSVFGEAGHPCGVLFFLLAINNQCWTADRLAKRGLPHPPACPLCDQAEENIQHTLISCVFARQIWTMIFQKLDLLSFAPQGSNIRFSGWWCGTIKGVPRGSRKGLNSLIILVACELWKHRNACVFKVLGLAQRCCFNLWPMSNLWCIVGASALNEFLARSLVLDP